MLVLIFDESDAAECLSELKDFYKKVADLKAGAAAAAAENKNKLKKKFVREKDYETRATMKS